MTPLTGPPRTGRRTTRRFGLVGVLVAIVALLATACGGSSTEQPGAGEARTINHIFGSTQVPANPQRVVSVGYTDVDFLLALGIKPVAYNDWFGTPEDEAKSFYLPWQQGPAAGATAPHIPTYDGLQIDKVAAATPDLIVATNGIDKAQYDLLSQIAPTVGPFRQGDDVPAWQDSTRYIASVFGMQERGDQLISDLEGRIAAVRTEHPEFTGKTLTFAAGGKDLYAYLPTDARNVLFQQLGFTLSRGVQDSARYVAADGTTGFSPENANLLDADVFVAQSYVPEDRATTEALPYYRNLNVVKRGDVIWPDQDTLNAITFGSVLSIPYALDKLVPQLAEKTRG